MKGVHNRELWREFGLVKYLQFKKETNGV